MPLPLPDLDNRSWADLVDEAHGVIPRHAALWTDHNAHDPGIMLIELFAWLTEQGMYRLNQVPDRHRRKFLRLVGFTPDPPQAARALVAFRPVAGTSAFSLPAGFELASARSGASRLHFRTLTPIDVLDVVVATLKVDEGDGTISDRTLDWHEELPVAPFGPSPGPGAALYLGFTSLPTVRVIRLGFRLDGPANGVEERRSLRAEAAAYRAASRPTRPGWDCNGTWETAEPVAPPLPPHHSARTVWEFSTGESWSRLEPAEDAGPLMPGQVRDDTRSLTLDGIVALNLPSTLAPTKAMGDGLLYLRCRLAAGAHDTPTPLLDVAPNVVWAEQAIPASHRYVIGPGVAPQGTAPKPGSTVRLQMTLDGKGVIQSLAFGATGDGPEVPVWEYQKPTPDAVGHIAMELVRVGRGSGFPGQSGHLPDTPVDLDSLRLYSLTAGTWEEWSRREDLDSSSRVDAHFAVDLETGIVAFGNGERGRTPEAGALLLAQYRVTAAAAGNRPAGTRLHPAATKRNEKALEAVPPKAFAAIVTLNPSLGGTDVESLAHASGRAVNALHSHERLVELCRHARSDSLDQIAPARIRNLEPPPRALNLPDIERLALAVPGTRVGRARAWADTHPSFPCLDVPGTVTVVVIPDAPGPKPAPTPGLLAAVRRALDLRRIVCTRIEVVGPTYREVRVRAGVVCDASADAVRLAVGIRDALDAFLNPLSGGPARRGWPFGRDVFRSEILQLIADVPGVDYVASLSLALDGRGTSCGNLELCATELVTSGAHEIEVTSP